MAILKPRPATSPATYADIEALPSHLTGELIFGALHAHPRPTPQHGEATSVLLAELQIPFGRRRGVPGGWIIQVEPELHLGPHVVVPDIAGWKTETLPRLPKTAYFEAAPDWLAEVLSPSTLKTDRTSKLQIYAEYGVKHLWYADPAVRTLEIFALNGTTHSIIATFKDEDVVIAPPFESHSFQLAALWQDDH